MAEEVDLGLSVKWSSMNLGATTPDSYGAYFAWGETEYKGMYNWSTYKWCKGTDHTLTRYCPVDKTDYWGGEGSPDNKTEFSDYAYADDAARQKLGGGWRIPTETEWTELKNNCTWTWTTMNGVNGYKVTSNKTNYTDKWIFLPASNNYPVSNNSAGRYWSSSLQKRGPGHARSLDFNMEIVSIGTMFRAGAASIRPVTE
jgi:hypothetical protein